MNNRGQGAKKGTLAEWVSLGLKKALTSANIKSGFKVTGIYPLNAHAVDKHFSPSEGFVAARPEEFGGDSDCSSEDDTNYADLLQEARHEPAQDTAALDDDEEDVIDDGVGSDDDLEMEGWDEPLAAGEELR